MLPLTFHRPSISGTNGTTGSFRGFSRLLHRRDQTDQCPIDPPDKQNEYQNRENNPPPVPLPDSGYNKGNRHDQQCQNE